MGLEFIADNIERYKRYAREFEEIFGCKLMPFWDQLTGFDVIKFDEKISRESHPANDVQLVVESSGIVLSRMSPRDSSFETPVEPFPRAMLQKRLQGVTLRHRVVGKVECVGIEEDMAPRSDLHRSVADSGIIDE